MDVVDRDHVRRNIAPSHVEYTLPLVCLLNTLHCLLIEENLEGEILSSMSGHPTELHSYRGCWSTLYFVIVRLWCGRFPRTGLSFWRQRE